MCLHVCTIAAELRVVACVVLERTFEGRARFGTAHWKLEALEEYGGSRPLAWIDDSLDASCYEWADQRPAPTLLVPTESDVGLLDVHVEVIESWAKDGFVVHDRG